MPDVRPGFVWHIARKEIVSTFRDRRALTSNLLIPLLLMPVVMMGLPLLMGGLFAREAVSVTPVAVEGHTALPTELNTMFAAQNLEAQVSSDALMAVQDGDFQVGLIVPEDFAELLAASQIPELTIVSRAGNMSSELAAGKLGGAITAYQQLVVQDRLAGVGLDPSVLTPIAMQMVDASTEQQRASGMMGWIIPFFIAMWALAGGQMTAIDATAGEKERGTMEALLVAPVRRGEVVVGKWLATTAFGMMAAAMAVVGFLLGGALMRGVVLPRLDEGADEMVAMMGGSLAISFGTVMELFISAVLLAGFIAALLIAVALFARSFKEAQSYLAPMSFIMVIPAVALQFRDFFDLGTWVYAVPILNGLLVMFDTIRGASEPMGLVITWISTIAATALLLMFAYRSFQRESVIFRT